MQFLQMSLCLPLQGLHSHQSDHALQGRSSQGRCSTLSPRQKPFSQTRDLSWMPGPQLTEHVDHGDHNDHSIQESLIRSSRYLSFSSFIAFIAFDRSHINDKFNANTYASRAP